MIVVNEVVKAEEMGLAVQRELLTLVADQDQGQQRSQGSRRQQRVE